MTLPLTSDERTVVGAYVRTIANRLGLRDWIFEFEHQPTNEDKAATIRAVYGTQHAMLRIMHAFRDEPADEQRVTLIHELLHIHREGIRLYFEETLPDLLGKPAHVAVIQAYRLLDETATDALAVAIAGDFPLIEWPTPDPVAP